MTRAPHELAARLDALLPQTQCRQCGYAGCRPYAEAIAEGRAGINQCPPGGEEGARELAELAGIDYRPIDRRFGEPKPPAVAIIDESRCIGCTLCIEACPVDAIVGASKLMHTVLAQACTGCELCIAPCPVDCIHLQPIAALPTPDARRDAATRARLRFERHNERLAGLQKKGRRAEDAGAKVNRQVIERAVARARERLALRGTPRK